jgi:DNA-binding Lrp family transcriptional regulator
VTAARRWQRLSDAGEAWTTVALGRRGLQAMSMAFLEIDCEAGAAVEVASTLATAEHLITVQHVAAGHDLFVIAVAASMPALADHLLTDLPRVPGVAKVRTHVATRVLEASRRWRLRVLPPRSARTLVRHPGPPSSSRPMDETDRLLFKALLVDGRAGYADLAEAVGKPERTVQRRVSRLVAVGDIDFRCDLARARGLALLGGAVAADAGRAAGGDGAGAARLAGDPDLRRARGEPEHAPHGRPAHGLRPAPAGGAPGGAVPVRAHR